MKRDLVVGLDCSTTAAKVIVWDAAGGALGEGRCPLPMTTPRPRWHEPQVFSRAARYLDVAAFLIGRLTGHFRTGWGCADPTGLFDMSRNAWAQNLLESIGVRTFSPHYVADAAFRPMYGGVEGTFMLEAPLLGGGYTIQWFTERGAEPCAESESRW